MHSRLDRTIRRAALGAMVACAALLATGAHAQSCVTGTVGLNGIPGTLTEPNQTDTLVTGNSFGSYKLKNWGDSTSVRVSNGGSATLQPTATYIFIGVPVGTMVDQDVSLYITGTSTVGLDGACASNSGEAALMVDNTYVARASFIGQGVTSQSGTPLSCTVTVPNTVLKRTFRRPAGTNFTISHGIYASSSPAGLIQLRMGRHFTRTVPGAALVRCDVLPTILDVGGRATNGLRIDSVWPNPSRGVFHANVFVPVGAPAFLRVFDLAGRVVMSRAVDPSVGARDVAFDTRMAPGTYFLHLQQGVQTAVRQVVIAQ